MNPAVIRSIAAATYREIIRERLLYGVLVVAALITAASFFLATISLDQNSRVLQNTGLASIHYLTLFITVFVATNSLNKDVEGRALYFLFPKPVSRADYVLGKYLGLLAFALTALAILGGLFVAGALALDSSIVGAAAINLGMSALELSLLTALAVLFGSFTAPLNASLYTLAFAFIGHSQSSLKNFFSEINNRFAEGLVNAVYYVLPNLEKFDVRKATLYEVPISAAHVLWAIAYWALLLAIVLYLAILAVRKREA